MRSRYSPGPPPTLGYLIAQGVEGVRCHCLACGRYAVLPLAPIAERVGLDLPFPALAGKLRCTSCGAKRAEARPDWPAIPSIHERT